MSNLAGAVKHAIHRYSGMTLNGNPVYVKLKDGPTTKRVGLPDNCNDTSRWRSIRVLQCRVVFHLDALESESRAIRAACFHAAQYSVYDWKAKTVTAKSMRQI